MFSDFAVIRFYVSFVRSEILSQGRFVSLEKAGIICLSCKLTHFLLPFSKIREEIIPNVHESFCAGLKNNPTSKIEINMYFLWLFLCESHAH